MKRVSPKVTGRRRVIKPFDELTKKQQASRKYYLKNRKPLLRDAPDFKVMNNIERTKVYRERHPDRVKASARKRYLRNPKASSEYRYNNWPQSHFGITRRNAERNAKRRGVEFNITTKFLHELYEAQGKVCALSKLAFVRGTNAGPSMFSISLDRIVPSLGYVPGNVRFVLHAINALKSTGTDEDVMLVISALAKAMLFNQAGEPICPQDQEPMICQ